MKSLLKGVFGLVIVALIGVLLYLGIRSRPGGGSPDAPVDVVRVRAGGEKIGFLEDPELAALLRKEFQLSVTAEKAGSVEMSRDLPVTDFDVLWPANEYCRQLIAERAAKAEFKVFKTEDIFNSPLVILSWPEPVRVFSAPNWKMIALRDDIHVVDMQKLLKVVEDKKPWKDPDINLPYNGAVLVKTTDPVKSSSGNLFAGLLADVMNGGDPAGPETMDTILPRVKAVFDRMGLKDDSSGTFFDHFLGQGVGSFPFGVAYENQLLELTLEQPDKAAVIRSKVIVLYPEPTVWATHPMVALTEKGKRLVDAMKDAGVQRIAWERHGFRTGASGSVNDPAVFQMRGIPQQIVSVVPLPEQAVMTGILDALESK